MEYFVGGYSYDEEWHRYINDNETMLLKVMLYSLSTYTRYGYIDPNCTWVE
jgi:6-phosphofructokinase 1